MNEVNTIIQGDSLEILTALPSECVDCVITSPPYWGLRDYGVEGQLGLEKTPEEYVAKMVEIFREVKRVLKKEGTLWLNLGDTYSAQRWTNSKGTGFMQTGKNSMKNEVIERQSSLPDKNLVGIPWRVAFALQADEWYLRQDIIWAKPNPMPESVTDRCTKSHEYIFLLTKSPKYYFDNEAIKENSVDPESYSGRRQRSESKINIEGGFPNGEHDHFHKNVGKKYEKRNKRSVWSVNTHSFKEAHFATFPEDLIVPMVKAGCPKGGLVLDIFMGAGTTAVVAKKLERNYLGIELNPEYIKIAEKRINSFTMLPFLQQSQTNKENKIV